VGYILYEHEIQDIKLFLSKKGVPQIMGREKGGGASRDSMSVRFPIRMKKKVASVRRKHSDGYWPTRALGHALQK